MRILILNGPNLNLLGTREPNIYGDKNFGSFLSGLKEEYPQVQFFYFQSNVEGELINKLHEFGFNADGIVLNAGGYTHTSVALADAVLAISAPVVEVHISNVFARESFRHHSFLAPNCRGTVSGFGLHGYRMAVDALVHGVNE